MVVVKIARLGFSWGKQVLDCGNIDRDSLALGPGSHYFSVVLNFLLVAFLFGSGCDDNPEVLKEGPPAETFQAVSTDSMPSVVDVIVDGTPSMQGFSESPEYRSLVAQSLANSSLSGTTVKYHRLTTAVPGGMSEVKNKIQVTNQNFYSRGDTELGRAISEAGPNRLVVLVTDLFQTDADMSRVAGKLTRTILEDDQAVGLFGVRLPFDGKIYDLGFDRRSFAFKGKRPLYGLVLGNPEAVSQYFGNLHPFVDPSDYQFLMFSSRIAAESGRIQSVDSTENLVQVAPNVIPRLPDPRYVSLRIRDNTQLGHLHALLKSNELPGVRPLTEAEGIGVNIAEVWKYDAQEESYTRSFSDSTTATRALTASVDSDGSGHGLRVEIQPWDLNSGHYCFNLAVGVDRWILPEWVSSWNLSPSQFQADEPDGTRTANLKPFLLNLASSVTESRFPQMATLQVFVEKGP